MSSLLSSLHILTVLLDLQKGRQLPGTRPTPRELELEIMTSPEASLIMTRPSPGANARSSARIWVPSWTKGQNSTLSSLGTLPALNSRRASRPMTPLTSFRSATPTGNIQHGAIQRSQFTFSIDQPTMPATLAPVKESYTKLPTNFAKCALAAAACQEEQHTVMFSDDSRGDAPAAPSTSLTASPNGDRHVHLTAQRDLHCCPARCGRSGFSRYCP